MAGAKYADVSLLLAEVRLYGKAFPGACFKGTESLSYISLGYPGVADYEVALLGARWCSHFRETKPEHRKKISMHLKEEDLWARN